MGDYFTPVEPMSMIFDGCIFTVKDRHSFNQGTFLSGLSPLTCPAWVTLLAAMPPRQGKDTTEVICTGILHFFKPW